MRKIIQIVATGHDNNVSTQSEFTIIALCEDGCLWAIDDIDARRDGKWRPIQGIPLAPDNWNPPEDSNA